MTADEHGVRRIDGGELPLGEIVRRQPVEPCERERHVPVLLDLDALELTTLLVQPARGVRRHGPERPASLRLRARDPGEEGDESGARLQPAHDLLERECHLRQPLEAAVEHDPVGVLSRRELATEAAGRANDLHVGGSRQHVRPSRLGVDAEHEARTGERGEPRAQKPTDERVVHRDLVLFQRGHAAAEVAELDAAPPRGAPRAPPPAERRV